MGIGGVLGHDQADQLLLGVGPIGSSVVASPGKGAFAAHVQLCRFFGGQGKSETKIVISEHTRCQLWAEHQFRGPPSQYLLAVVLAPVQEHLKENGIVVGGDRKSVVEGKRVEVGVGGSG